MAERLYAIVLRPEGGWDALRGGYPRDAVRPAKRQLGVCAAPVTSLSDAHRRFGAHVVSVVTGPDKAQREVASLAGAGKSAASAGGLRLRRAGVRS